MRFRIKSGQSARRFVFDRTPAPAKPPQPSAPRAADTSGFGSADPTTTRLMPASRIAFTHGGCFPK